MKGDIGNMNSFLKSCFVWICMISLCSGSVHSAEPNWKQIYSKAHAEAMASFKVKKVGDHVSVTRRVGGYMKGLITAISDDSVRIRSNEGNFKFKAADLTDATCMKLFPKMYADKAARKKVKAARYDYFWNTEEGKAVRVALEREKKGLPPVELPGGVAIDDSSLSSGGGDVSTDDVEIDEEVPAAGVAIPLVGNIDSGLNTKIIFGLAGATLLFLVTTIMLIGKLVDAKKAQAVAESKTRNIPQLKNQLVKANKIIEELENKIAEGGGE